MCKWLPPNGFTGTVDHVDARVGGTYKMSFTNFGNGQSHSFGGSYVELILGEKIVHDRRVWRAHSIRDDVVALGRCDPV